MTKFYNPHNYAVSFTTADGGRITLPSVIPGRDIKSVEGDYYHHLVKRSTLAILTPEVGKANVAAYRQIMTPKRKSKLPLARGRAPQQADKPMGNVQATPPPVNMTEKAFEKAAAEPMRKDPEPVVAVVAAPEPVVVEPTVDEVDDVMFNKDVLDEMNMKDLYAVIKANDDFGTPPKGAKKKDLINLILKSQ